MLGDVIDLLKHTTKRVHGMQDCVKAACRCFGIEKAIPVVRRGWKFPSILAKLTTFGLATEATA